MNRTTELQTFAAAQEARARGDDPMAKVEEEVLVDARFEEKKGGVRLCAWLRYASLQAERPDNEGLSAHMRKHWDCPQCAEHFIVSSVEIDEHKRVCSGRTLQEISKEEIDSTPLPSAKGTSISISTFALSFCDLHARGDTPAYTCHRCAFHYDTSKCGGCDEELLPLLCVRQDLPVHSYRSAETQAPRHSRRTDQGTVKSRIKKQKKELHSP